VRASWCRSRITEAFPAAPRASGFEARLVITSRATITGLHASMLAVQRSLSGVKAVASCWIARRWDDGGSPGLRWASRVALSPE
jgi:hypothetical protein